MGEQKAKEEGLFFMEVSAKMNMEKCVEIAFNEFLKQIWENHGKMKK